MIVVLVAEHNDDAVKLLEEELPKNEYEAIHVRDGLEVLSVMDSIQVALAFVELELPSVNGLSIIGRLASQNPRPKIIATTFLEDDLVCELAKHLGADAVVRKSRPQETGTLRQVLPELVGRVNRVAV